MFTVARNENHASGDYSSVTGGESNTAGAVLSSVTGGYTNAANGFASSVASGEYNIAGDDLSWIGAGCDNLTGSGTANTDSCDPGGEALLGGASITLTGQDTHSP